ncbi:gamma-interferon-inducible lysosomal thiol reductase-like precursor [Acyrthosiphon pisum]|uniref:ACYPI004563 protein n=1 Tax=Acyrthosiphon pisum TaxID=7029 RepID=C4WYA2_ACYPI|nr:gamma-interferon-inducible lysosomal thiol reductase-like precursor [Acyrthosiphon pisum]BAH72872.1 ACYPI004563 [Acyrthosiphon pisum]|eukprot:NP_001155577.1 gamma-interferon-inducible lysosomal thiol reductase-like precursor [Acyrthosiphon pisum]
MKCLMFVVAVAAFAAVSADRIKRAPLKVSVYYESHCPDSRDFIISQLHPYFCKVQQYLNLNLVAFGKAYSSDQGFTCQHGPKECRGNTIHNCVLKRIQDSKAQVDYVNCAMYDPDQPGHIEKTCVEESGLNVDQVQKCFSSSEGYEMMLKAEIETKTMTPGPLFVPTIVFDDVYNENDQNQAFVNFESTLCEKLISHGHTNVCSNGVIRNTQTC